MSGNVVMLIYLVWCRVSQENLVIYADPEWWVGGPQVSRWGSPHLHCRRRETLSVFTAAATISGVERRGRPSPTQGGGTGLSTAFPPDANIPWTLLLISQSAPSTRTDDAIVLSS